MPLIEGVPNQQRLADAAAQADLVTRYAALVTGLENIQKDMAGVASQPAPSAVNLATIQAIATAVRLVASDVHDLAQGAERELKAVRVILRQAGVG